jgi:hypothetical protein
MTAPTNRGKRNNERMAILAAPDRGHFSCAGVTMLSRSDEVAADPHIGQGAPLDVGHKDDR